MTLPAHARSTGGGSIHSAGAGSPRSSPPGGFTVDARDAAPRPFRMSFDIGGGGQSSSASRAQVRARQLVSVRGGAEATCEGSRSNM